MKHIREIGENLLKALENDPLQTGIQRAVGNASPAVRRIIEENPHIEAAAKEIRETREKVTQNILHYLSKAMDKVRRNSGMVYFAKTKDDVFEILGEIVGTGKLIVKSKSMVTEEIGLREYLTTTGNEVWETDLGELLIQITKDKPMHTLAPAIHVTKEKAAQVLKILGIDVNESTKFIEEIVAKVRGFLREKFVNADIGISGANVVAADTGSIFFIENEGNIRNSTNLPRKHIVIVGVEKIMPTMHGAFSQAMVQAAYSGLYPPAYISLISSPSSTADIEYCRVYGVHGPKELYVVFYDGGRVNACKHPYLKEQLLCIKCGRCQIECPVWNLVANIWGGKVYGGPMGIGWIAITEGKKLASALAQYCMLCGRCKQVCPVNVDIPKIARYLKGLAYH